MADTALPSPPPPVEILGDDVVELGLLRVLGPADVESRPPEARFLARTPERRFAIHRRANGMRGGRIHLRPTDDPTIVRGVGHSGYEVDEPHRRHGCAARALAPVRHVARHHHVAPLWVLIAPANVASPRTAGAVTAAVRRAGVERSATDGPMGRQRAWTVAVNATPSGVSPAGT